MFGLFARSVSKVLRSSSIASLILFGGIFPASISPAQAAPIQVDLSNTGRGDSAARHFEEWQVQAGDSISRTFDGVTVEFSGVGGGIGADWYKGGLDFWSARLVADGLVGSGGAASVQMSISGLSPGKHTLVTYHNAVANPAGNSFGKIKITRDGKPAGADVTMTARALHADDAATGFVAFEAEAGKPVVLNFSNDNSGTNHDVIINGFIIDAPNPAKQALMPAPEHDDLHAAAEGGKIELKWRAAKSAASHDVYFGEDAAAVEAADATSPAFKGNVKEAAYSASGLTNLKDYFWRVDEVDASGAKTPGRVWTFRPQHLAFPTAEGYGRFAIGGRGGKVLHVTNINDSGPGSLREAILADFPRTIVFDVSGLIVLQTRLIMHNPFCTVAGQTAPGDGICLSNYNFGLLGMRDGIVRFMRVRPGNTSGQTLDGMGMASTDNSIIDHCSISWTLDESFSSRSGKNITFQRNLISEALNEAGHRRYPPGTQHGYAASIGGDVGSFHHNLLANCAGRNWSLAGGMDKSGVLSGRLDLRNNVVYNWKHRATDGGAMECNFVNNYYKPGPATTLFAVLIPQFEGFNPRNVKVSPQRYYVMGNVLEGKSDADNRYGAVRSQPEMPYEFYTVEQPFFESHVKTDTAAQAYESVLADVGANKPKQDSVDMRAIESTRTGTTKLKGSKTGLPGLPDSQDDAGGWPKYSQETRPADFDTDGDGLPNAWEAEHKLAANNAADGALDPDGDGYTNLEDYLHFMAGDLERAGGKQTAKADK